MRGYGKEVAQGGGDEGRELLFGEEFWDWSANSLAGLLERQYRTAKACGHRSHSGGLT